MRNVIQKTFVTFVMMLLLACTKEVTNDFTKGEKIAIVGKELKTRIDKSVENDEISVKLEQAKTDTNGVYCVSTIFILDEGEVIDSLIIGSEPVGGGYGLSCSYRIEGHYVFAKQGGYNGKTIIVDNKGRVYKLLGGSFAYDEKSSLLFSIYDSDLPGCSVFDLKNDKVLFESSDIDVYPISFHRNKKGEYFIYGIPPETDERVFRKIDIDSKKLISVDKVSKLSSKEIKIISADDIKCDCQE